MPLLEPKEIKIKDGTNELVFRIGKMPATEGEDWLGEALFLVGNSIEKMNDDESWVDSLILAIAHVPYKKAKPILNQLLNYAERKVEGGYNPVSLETMDGYIKSPMTITKLRLEVLKHNLSFLPQEYRLKAEQYLAKARNTNTPRMQTSVKLQD